MSREPNLRALFAGADDHNSAGARAEGAHRAMSFWTESQSSTSRLALWRAVVHSCVVSRETCMRFASNEKLLLNVAYERQLQHQ
jgi:hypothetical protein